MAVQMTLHVAPSGCDGWSGLTDAPDTQATDGPLRTFAGARDKLRRLRDEGKLTGPAEVRVHAGLYTLDETLAFDERDLGDADAPVTFRDAGDGEVILAGGAHLTGFTPVDDDKKVWRLDLAAAGHKGLEFGQLFCNGVRQQVARYPSYDGDHPYDGGWLYREGEPVSAYAQGHGEKDRFICTDPRLKEWTRFEEIELFVFPRYNFWNCICRLESYDPETGEVRLAEKPTYEIYPGDRFYFRNVREELTEPGEWYLDRDKDVLYFYPPCPMEEAVVTVPLVRDLLVVNGPKRGGLNADAEYVGGGREPSPESTERGFITFRGFTLDGCDGDGAVFRNVRRCRLAKCFVRNTGGSGVRVVGGIDCAVHGCDIYEVGARGIDVNAGLRRPFNRSYLPCNHDIRNNYIHHNGVFLKGSCAIGATGVGITVAHNLVHDTPRHGVAVGGNDHVIEYNHFRHVNVETSDTSAINFCDRDLTKGGSKIRYNHVHDCLGYHWDAARREWQQPAYCFGIYLDDWTSHDEIVGNLVYRTPSPGLFLHAGQNNHVENNVFYDCGAGKGVSQQFAWMGWMERATLGTYAQSQRRNRYIRNITVATADDTPIHSYNPNLAEWPPVRCAEPLPPDAAAEIPETIEMDGRTFEPVEFQGDELELFRVLGADRDTRCHVIAYAFRTIESDTDRTISWSFGAHRGKAMWCNGEEILRKLDTGNAAGNPEDEPVELNLRKGTNVLQFRVIAANAWRLLVAPLPDDAGVRWAGPWKVFGPIDNPQTEEDLKHSDAENRTGIATCRWERNVRWNTAGDVAMQFRGKMSFTEWQAMGLDADSVVADPKFADPENGDFTLADDSPAMELGFERLPVEKMGPYEDELRASWPIVEAEGIREHPMRTRPQE